MALNLIIHTFRMIFGNLGQALRISIGPYLILIVVALGLFAASGVPSGMSADVPNISPLAAIIPLILLPLVLFITAWVAVSWHRFILLEEYAGALPAVSGRPIWPYAGKALLLGLLLAVVAIPLFLILGTVLMPLMGGAGLPPDPTASTPFVAIIIFAIAMILLTILSLRWGVALVGTALGKPLGFKQAWDATKPISGVIVSVAIILGLINIVPGQIISMIYNASGILGAILEICLTWLTMMLGISILTTIYGHVIENRPLVS